MGVNQMTGTPWHLETLRMNEDDERRHKSRCIYYYKPNKNCKRLNTKCPGSAHCDHYKEDPSRIRDISTSKEGPISRTPIVAKIQPAVQKVPVSKMSYDGTILYPVGCRVNHKSHGLGIVSEVSKDYVTVKFAEGYSKELSVDYCVKNSLLVREITEEMSNGMKKEMLVQEKNEASIVPEPIVSEERKPEFTQFKESACVSTTRSHIAKTSDSKSKSKNVICWIVSVVIALVLLSSLYLYFVDFRKLFIYVEIIITQFFLALLFMNINPLTFESTSSGIIKWAKEHTLLSSLLLFVTWFIISNCALLLYASSLTE